jgi:NADH:ubiquinone oxidoreductase subunit 2 (subunit N)
LAFMWFLELKWLAVTVVFFSVLSCYYYLRVIKIICFDRHSVWLLHKKLHFLCNYFSYFNSSWFLFYCLAFFWLYCIFMVLIIILFFPWITSYFFYLLEPLTFMSLLWLT